MKKMNLFGYTYKIYDNGYKTEMRSKECNAGDPLETPGGLYRGPPSNENTIFKKMCMFVYYECQSVTVVVRAVLVQSF